MEEGADAPSEYDLRQDRTAQFWPQWRRELTLPRSWQRITRVRTLITAAMEEGADAPSEAHRMIAYLAGVLSGRNGGGS